MSSTTRRKNHKMTSKRKITPWEASVSIRADVGIKQAIVFADCNGLEKVEKEFGSTSHHLKGVRISYLDGDSDVPCVHFVKLGNQVVVDFSHGQIPVQKFDKQEDAIEFVREIEKELENANKRI